jgi:ligand-binding sensor domain-containing protein
LIETLFDLIKDKRIAHHSAADHVGVNIYDKKTGQIEVLLNDPNNPNSISQNSVISLFADETGIMWAGTYKNGVSYCHEGMFKFGKSPLFYFNHPQLENKDCNSLYEDSKGNLWIGTNGSGLLRYQKSTGAFKVYRHDKNNPASVSSDIVISALEDRSGTLWLGTFLGGLNRMRGENFERFLPQINNPGAISNKSIYGMAEDDQNRLWIATLGADVEMLDAERKVFTHYNRSNTRGLSSEFVLSMFTHNRNPVYLSTAAGVDVLNTASGNISRSFCTLFSRLLTIFVTDSLSTTAVIIR